MYTSSTGMQAPSSIRKGEKFFVSFFQPLKLKKEKRVRSSGGKLSERLRKSKHELIHACVFTYVCEL